MSCEYFRVNDGRKLKVSMHHKYGAGTVVRKKAKTVTNIKRGVSGKVVKEYRHED